MIISCMKFDDIYNEALANTATPTQNPAAPATGTSPTTKTPDSKSIMNQFLQKKYTPEQLANYKKYVLQNINTATNADQLFKIMMGPDEVAPQTTTTTPPVVQNPQPTNKPQVTTTPAI